MPTDVPTVQGQFAVTVRLRHVGESQVDDPCVSAELDIVTVDGALTVVGRGRIVADVAEVTFDGRVMLPVAIDLVSSRCGSAPCPQGLLVIPIEHLLGRFVLGGQRTRLERGSFLGGAVFVHDFAFDPARNATGFTATTEMFANEIGLDSESRTELAAYVDFYEDLHLEADGTLSPCPDTRVTNDPTVNALSPGLGIDSL